MKKNVHQKPNRLGNSKGTSENNQESWFKFKMHQVENFKKYGNNLWNNRSVGSLNGLVLSCPIERVLVRELKSILGQLHIPHVAHHCFENENSQSTIAHFDGDKTYIATHQGWNVCPHSIAKKLQIYHIPHNGQTLRSHDLFIGTMGYKIKALDKNSPPHLHSSFILGHQ